MLISPKYSEECPFQITSSSWLCCSCLVDLSWCIRWSKACSWSFTIPDILLAWIVKQYLLYSSFAAPRCAVPWSIIKGNDPSWNLDPNPLTKFHIISFPQHPPHKTVTHRQFLVSDFWRNMSFPSHLAVVQITGTQGVKNSFPHNFVRFQPFPTSRDIL